MSESAQATPENPPRRRGFRVRHALVAVGVLALVLTIVRPWLHEPVDWLERRVGVGIHWHEINDHVHHGPERAGDAFALLRAAKVDEFRAMSTRSFREEWSAVRLRDFLADHPAIQSDPAMTAGFVTFHRGVPRSTYAFEGGTGDARSVFRLEFVTEGGEMRVDDLWVRPEKGVDLR